MVPTSLFTSMIETSWVFGRRTASTALAETMPGAFGLIRVTSKPNTRSKYDAISSTEEGSKLDRRTCAGCAFQMEPRDVNVPFIAQFFASVPPEVNESSDESHPPSRA